MARVFFIALLFLSTAHAARLRDLGLTVGHYSPGKYNAITDVEGVAVGQVTLNEGGGPLIVGKGPVRTGVTAIIPAKGDLWENKVAAGSFVLNGNGEAMGLMWLQESGILETPILLTNTLSVSAVQRGVLDWVLKRKPKIGISDDTLTPLVLECDDGSLNDIRGQHVKPEHAVKAIETAKSGPVAEGSVGAGTGMITYEFKGGIGTSSRALPKREGGYTVGVLVNANHGHRHLLQVNGKPVGSLMEKELLPKMKQEGSIIIIIATDAPLDARQLSRLSKRSVLGLARTGGIATHGSGDVAIAFSTANRIPHYPSKATFKMTHLSDFWINPLFEAVAEATEEAVLNALVNNQTVVGRDNNTVYALPHDKLKSF